VQASYAARDGHDEPAISDWVEGCSKLLDPLVETLRRYVMAAGKVHADDTRVPVLAPGNGSTIEPAA